MTVVLLGTAGPARERRFGAGSVGLWAVRWRDDPLLIGFVGLPRVLRPARPATPVRTAAYTLGQGLATEAAATTRRFASETLGCAEIRAPTDIPNAAASAVLWRLGFSLAPTADDGEYGTALYVITRQRHERTTPSASTPTWSGLR